MTDSFEEFRDGVIKAFMHASYKGYTNSPEKIDIPSHNDYYEAGVAYGSAILTERGTMVFEHLSESQRKEVMRQWA